MKVLKTAGNVALVFLAIISVVVMVIYGLYSYFVDETTVGVNNISDQIAVDIKYADDLSEDEKNELEERWFMEANYYSNDKKNGIELQELNFNYFTSYELTSDSYRATGMQYVGDWSNPTQHITQKEVDTYVYDDFYYYDTTDGISFNGYSGSLASSVGTVMNRKTSFIIKIDDRAFSIKLDGTFNSGWWIFSWTNYYTYGDLFKCVFDAIESNSAGYGDYYITLDLSEFFSIKEFDPSSGKFYGDNVTDVIKNYAVLKFHYDENGATRSTQSIFGHIKNNSIYDFEGVDYWQERMVYTLTEEDLSYRYSETYQGYFISLDLETKKFFDDMPRTKLLVKLDLSSSWIEEHEYNVVGIDYNGFSGFDIDTLTIKGESRTLYVLDNAFKDVKLTKLEHSEGIVFEGLVLEELENTEVYAI